VTGVISVLTRGGEVTWRVIATAFTTAAAAAVMLPVSMMVDRKETRRAGLLGMTVVVVEFILALFTIWQVPRVVWGVRVEEEIAVTMVTLAGGAIIAIGLTQALCKPIAALAGRAGLVLVAATFTALLLAIWSWSEDWGETGGALAACGTPAVLCLIGVGVGSPRPWRWMGILGAVVACALWLVNVWVGTGSDLGTVVFALLISTAAATAHANVCVLCSVPASQAWVRVGANLAAVVTAGLICLIVVDEVYARTGISQDFLWRCTAATGIVAACGTLALAILMRLNRRVDYEPLSDELTEMTLVCPRCRKKQSVMLGDSVCVGCKLRISVRVEEPRCPQCGYLLFGLTSDRCPECGTAIGSGAVGSTDGVE
ncbi:MAG: hypothetical protein PVI86_18575, partial [Phycisphaerae bacterium]|jgi:hypothetical protein